MLKNDLSFIIADTMNLYESSPRIIQICRCGAFYTLPACTKTMSLEQAINKAVEDCISENILADFLRAHRTEVLRVYLAEVNQTVLRNRLIEDGQRLLLTSQITKKVRAGKSLEQIAAEVEETPEAIREIYEGVVKELNQL